MSNRQRLTWQDGGAKAASEQPVLPIERAASAHPATPDEGPASPAYGGADPEADAYENGDTSSWAEDPTTGPYPNSAHPATPDEGPASPAYKAAAENLKIAVERKAAKCIRIAAAMLPGRAANVIEDQALDFMDLPDAAITATLSRLAEDEGKKEEEEAAETVQEEVEEEAKEEKKASEDEALLRRLLAEEEMESDEESEEEAAKEASAAKSATEQILAAINALGARINALETGKKAQDEEIEEEVEETDAEGKKTAEADDVEAMLAAMLAEEAPEAEATACGPMAQDEEPEAETEAQFEDDMSIDMTDINDPMGLMDEADLMSDDEEALLANLFADRRLAKKAEDEDDDEEEVEEEVEEEAEEEAEGEVEAKRKAAAARKPQPKKASTGATRLGQQTRTAGSDISSLEKLWETAPDVSGVFK